MKTSITLFIASCLLASGVAAQDGPRRDVLIIERVANTSGVSKPSKGMSMAQVEKRFGSPNDRRGAIGEPPIARWVYPEFTVYFEHQHVIHAVVNRASPTESPVHING